MLLNGAASARGQSIPDGFNPNANGPIRAVVVQPDGKILIGGDFTTLQPDAGAPIARDRIARLNSDGTVDTAFIANSNNRVESIAVQPDGKVLVGGWFTQINGQTRDRIARLDATTGAPDSFNPGANGIVYSIAVQADGKVLFGGVFNGPNSVGTQTRNFIARADATGLVDSFDPSANNAVYSIVVQGDGQILAGGSFTSIGAKTRNCIARLDPSTGIADPLFDPNSTGGNNGLIFSVALQPDGKILVAGEFLNIGGQPRPRIARLETSGVADSFQAVPSSSVFSVVPQADGKILLAGGFNTVNGQNRKNVGRVNADGTLDTAFDPNPNNSVYAIAAQADGKIILVGQFTAVAPDGGQTVTRNYIARLESFFVAPVINSPLNATGTVGQRFVYQFEAIGATSLGVTNLPPGLSFNATLKAITGTPTSAGSFQLGLNASNAGGTTNATLTLTLQPSPSSGPTIISSTAVTGRTAQAFRFQAVTTGGTAAARLTATNLPAGLAADSITGVISGIPASDGSFPVTLSVTERNLTTTSTLQLTFTSNQAVPVIISPDRAILSPGKAFTYTVIAPVASSGDPPKISFLGTLPAGLSFDPDTGVISGVYSGNSTNAGDSPQAPTLNGGALLGSIQLFATNSFGVATFQLLFLSAPSGAVNISTRILVGTGENVLIGGFIITGNAPKAVILRAIGPSLKIASALLDPLLQLNNEKGDILINDDWQDTQEQIIADTTIPPVDSRESALVVALDPGPYTAIVSGKNGNTGIALVEIYDLGTASLEATTKAQLAQISTRGNVLIGDDVMIGGFIVSEAATKILVRAIGPSLSEFGIANALEDPGLELRDGSGSLINFNDDWRSTQEQQIIETTVPPTDNRESAILATINPGNYTAIVRGKENTTGVALVEIYGLE